MTAVDFVLRVVDALERLSIPYMAVGSFSTNVYGNPRSTKDADFVLELGNHSMTELSKLIGADFTLDSQMSFETVTSTMRYRMFHQSGTFSIEFFMLSDDPHDQARFARRVRGLIGGRPAFVPTAEDVVITKLRWSRHGKRQKDLDDAQDVLDVQFGKLDLGYIRRWSDQHGTRDIFERLQRAAAELNDPPIN
jgi:hypothetical protein